MGGFYKISRIFLFVLVISFLLVNSLSVDAAKSVKRDFRINESLEVEGKNITLVSLDNVRDKVIICVNNFKTIIREDYTKIINEAEIEVKEIKEKYATLRIYTDCKDCVCGDECSNRACFDLKDECSTDKDCNDNNETTTDACVGTPKQCYHVLEKVETIEEKETEEQIISEADEKVSEEKIVNSEKLLVVFFGFVAVLIVILLIIALWKKIK